MSNGGFFFNTRTKTYGVDPEAFKNATTPEMANPPKPLNTSTPASGGAYTPFLEAIRVKGCMRGMVTYDPTSRPTLGAGLRDCVLQNYSDDESTAYSGTVTRLDGRWS